MILFAKQRHRCKKQMYGCQVGKGEDEFGDCDWHIYTIDTMYKTDNLWDLLYSSGNCGDPNGKEIQKRGDICMYTLADSLCCTVETNITL